MQRDEGRDGRAVDRGGELPDETQAVGRAQLDLLAHRRQLDTGSDLDGGRVVVVHRAPILQQCVCQ